MFREYEPFERGEIASLRCSVAPLTCMYPHRAVFSNMGASDVPRNGQQFLARVSCHCFLLWISGGCETVCPHTPRIRAATKPDTHPREKLDGSLP